MRVQTDQAGSPGATGPILFCSTTEGLWGGSEVLWSQAALVLRRQGVRLAAFFPYYKNIAPIRALADAGVELFFGTPPPTRWWRRLGRRAASRTDYFARCLEQISPALVVCNQGAVRDGLLEMAACRDRRIPYAIITQAVEPLHYDDPTWKRVRAAFTQARHIWFVSSENSGDLQRFLGESLPQAEIIPNAYGCAFDVRCPWPEEKLPFRLAVVARLEPEQKAQDLVLRVLARDRWRQRPLQVSFFGDGSAREQLKTSSAQLGLTAVDFAGEAGVAEIWRRHHALLLPSRYEGQSLAMIEAMLHGRPVIATPVGGTAGVVLEGQTGFLAHAVGDADALDEVLERAWADRERWPQLGEAAGAHIRRTVWKDFGTEFAQRLKVVAAAS